ncbi:MAG: hypothetical protein V3V78_03675 [Candidatus Woesearchaeota archaeon]
MSPAKKFEDNIENLNKLIEKQLATTVQENRLKSKFVDMLKNRYRGQKIIGLFYKFDAGFTTKDGTISTSGLMNLITDGLVRSGMVVINEDYIHEKCGNLVCKEMAIISKIKEEMEVNSDKTFLSDFSEFLASIIPNAIFFLINADTCSIDEAKAFHKNTLFLDKFSLAFMLTEKMPEKFCEYCIERETHDGKTYHVCISNNFREDCKSQEELCFLTKEKKLSASHIEHHINSTYSRIVIVDFHKDLDKLILEMIL